MNVLYVNSMLLQCYYNNAQTLSTLGVSIASNIRNMKTQNVKQGISFHVCILSGVSMFAERCVVSLHYHSLLLLLLVHLHNQSSSSDEVGGLLQVLQGNYYTTNYHTNSHSH